MDRRSRFHRSVFSPVLNDDVSTLEAVLLGGRPSDKDTHQLTSARDDSGNTALHLSAAHGSSRCTSMLLAHQASFRDRDVEGSQTALHRALYHGHLGCSLALIAAGAAVDNDQDNGLLRVRNEYGRWAGKVWRAPAPGSVHDREGWTPSDLLSARLLGPLSAVRAHLQSIRSGLLLRPHRARAQQAQSSNEMENGDDGDDDLAQLLLASGSGSAGAASAVKSPPLHPTSSRKGSKSKRNRARADSGASSGSRRSRGPSLGEYPGPDAVDDGQLVQGLFAAFAAATGEGAPTLAASHGQMTVGIQQHPQSLELGLGLGLAPPVAASGSGEVLGHNGHEVLRGLDWASSCWDASSEAEASTAPWLGGPPIVYLSSARDSADGGRGRSLSGYRSRSNSDASGGPAQTTRAQKELKARLNADDPYSSTKPAVVVAPLLSEGGGVAHVVEPSAWRCGVYTWGKQDYQLGYSTGADLQALPRALDLDDGMAAIMDTERSSTQGSSTAGPDLSPLQPVHADPVIVAASAGRFHTLLLSKKGVPLVFGVGQGGRLGMHRSSAAPKSGGSSSYDDSFMQLNPTAIPFFLHSRLVVTAVCAGERHSLALCSSGAVYAWGDNRSGACGLGNPYSSTTTSADSTSGLVGVPTGVVPVPRRIEGSLRRARAVSIAAGPYHSAICLSDGTVWSWGSNWTGQLGIRDVGTGGPTALTSKPTAASATVTPAHICWYPRKTDALPPPSLNSTRRHGQGGGQGGLSAGNTPVAQDEEDDGSLALLLGGGSSSSLSAQDKKAAKACSVCAADAYSVAVSVEGEVFMCGGGSTAWIRVPFDAAVADTEDAVAAYLEAAAGITASKAAEAAVSNGTGSTAQTGAPSGGGSSNTGSSSASKGGTGNTPSKNKDKHRGPQEYAVAPSADASAAPVVVPDIYGREGREAAETLSRYGFHVVPSIFSSSSALATSGAVQDESAWTTSTSRPVKVKGLVSGSVSSSAQAAGQGGVPAAATISAGASSTALSAFASLSTGRSSVIRPAAIIHVHVAKNHAVAVDSEGGVWTWGCSAALLGHGDKHGSPAVGVGADGVQQWRPPRRVSALARAGVRITRAACSNHHTIAVAADGRVYSWGSTTAADRGILGHGKGVAASLPRRIAAIQQVVDCCAGEAHSLVIGAVFLPPLPPPRPGPHDLAVSMLRYGDSQPRVEIPGAMMEALSASLAPPGSRHELHDLHAAVSLRLYGAVVREELAAARQLAEVYKDFGVDSDRDEPPGAAARDACSSSVHVVVPSLRSICERVLAAGVGVGSAASMLAIAEDYNAPGLAAYCGAVLSANMPATLAYLTVGKGKVRDRDVLLQHSDGLVRWRYIPPSELTAIRARETAGHRQLVSWYKTVKRREYEMIRPTSQWRGLSDRRRAARLLGDLSTAGSGNAASAMLPKHMEGVIAEDVTRIRKMLFAGAKHGTVAGETEGEDGELPSSGAARAAGAGPSPGSSLPPSTLRQRARLHSESSAGARDRQESVDASTVSMSFQEAYDAILRVRHGESATSSSASGHATEHGEHEHGAEHGTGHDSDHDEEGEGFRSRHARRGRPAGHGGRTHGHLQSSAASLLVAPAYLSTTLPPAAPAAVQSSLDRLAANLVELHCGPGMAGPLLSPMLASAWSIASGGRAGGGMQSQGLVHGTEAQQPRLTLDAAKGIVTTVMLTDAAALLKRVKGVKKKLMEATALAVHACGLQSLDAAGGSAAAEATHVAVGPGRLPALDNEQRGKLSRRLEMACEVYSVEPFLSALSTLLLCVHSACENNSTGAAQAQDAFLDRVHEVAEDAGATAASIQAMYSAGLTAGALLRGASAAGALLGPGANRGHELHTALQASIAGAGSCADVDTVRAILTAGGSGMLMDRASLEQLVCETVVGAQVIVYGLPGHQKQANSHQRQTQGKAKGGKKSGSKDAAQPSEGPAAPAPAPAASATTFGWESHSKTPSKPGKQQRPSPPSTPVTPKGVAAGTGASSPAPAGKAGPVVVQSASLEASLWDMIRQEAQTSQTAPGTAATAAPPIAAFLSAGLPAAAPPAPLAAGGSARPAASGGGSGGGSASSSSRGLRDILAAEEQASRARAAAVEKSTQAKLAAALNQTKAEEAAAAAAAAKLARLKAAIVPGSSRPAVSASSSGVVGTGAWAHAASGHTLADIRREQEQEQKRLAALRGSVRSPFADLSNPLDMTKNAWGMGAVLGPSAAHASSTGGGGGSGVGSSSTGAAARGIGDILKQQEADAAKAERKVLAQAEKKLERTLKQSLASAAAEHKEAGGGGRGPRAAATGTAVSASGVSSAAAGSKQAAAKAKK